MYWRQFSRLSLLLWVGAKGLGSAWMNTLLKFQGSQSLDGGQHPADFWDRENLSDRAFYSVSSSRSGSLGWRSHLSFTGGLNHDKQRSRNQCSPRNDGRSGGR